jgi:chlorite dismutase/nitrite reductase/ring-hydroxylating ferredoxin subunit
MEAQARRQFVKFVFFKVDPAWRGLPADERARGKAAFAEVLGDWSKRVVLRPYSLVGVRGDCDMLLWLVSERLEDFQELHTQLLRTPLAPYLSMPYSYLALTKRSVYVDRYASEEEAASRHIIVPGMNKYLFVYPFVKTRAWYMLSLEERQKMMDEHIRLGRKYPDVKLNTTYSFGLDDQEFVVAFESDDAGRFADLVMELRDSVASSYTLRDTPTFTCIATSAKGMLDALGGATVGAPAAVSYQAEPAGGAGQPAEHGPAGQERDEYYSAARVEDIPQGGTKLVVVRGEQIALFNLDGEIYALSNRCSHSRGPLVDGTLGEGTVTCPWHSACFDLRTGQDLAMPARGPVPAYEVKVAGGVVFVGPQKNVVASS